MSLSQTDCVLLLGGVGVASLTLYAVMGGADYGGGFWDLLATGPRKDEQRKTIEKAIGPIWEANHVWLILIVVLLFSCFPRAFYTASIALHIPLTLLLFGIVLRGSAFTFRTYDSEKDEVQKRWGRIFAISSTITPVMLRHNCRCNLWRTYHHQRRFLLSISISMAQTLSHSCWIFCLDALCLSSCRLSHG
jgi:cytochrome bd-type quinol oxidase subunit 2